MGRAGGFLFRIGASGNTLVSAMLQCVAYKGFCQERSVVRCCGHLSKQADEELCNGIHGSVDGVGGSAPSGADQIGNRKKVLGRINGENAVCGIVAGPAFLIAVTHMETLEVVQFLQSGVTVGFQFRFALWIQGRSSIRQVQHCVNIHVIYKQALPDQGGHFQETAAAGAAADTADNIHFVLAGRFFGDRCQCIALQTLQMSDDFLVYDHTRVLVVEFHLAHQSVTPGAGGRETGNVLYLLRIREHRPGIAGIAFVIGCSLVNL